MRAQNIHDKKKWKKKKHPASKCSNTKCIICHSDKILDIPDRQRKRADDILKQEIKTNNQFNRIINQI